MRLYHGTENYQQIMEEGFDPARSPQEDFPGGGAYFTDSVEFAGMYGTVLEVEVPDHLVRERLLWVAGELPDLTASAREFKVLWEDVDQVKILKVLRA